MKSVLFPKILLARLIHPLAASDEKPVHEVQVSPFYIQATEVTKEQWELTRIAAVELGYTDLPVGTNPR